MGHRQISRRNFLYLGVAGSTTALVPPLLLTGCGGGSASAAAQNQPTLTEMAWGDGWQTDGVANLLTRGDNKLLQGGSNVFPHDPRAVAFVSDRRFLNGDVQAHMAATGAGGGVVLRRTGPFTYYAAVYNALTETFSLIRKTGRRFGDAGTETSEILQTLTDESEKLLDLTPAVGLNGPVTITGSANSPSANGTQLTAYLDTPLGIRYKLSAFDSEPALQQPGDAGLLATAFTGLVGNPGLPLLPSLGALFVTDLGAKIESSPVGKVRSELITALSTAEIAGFQIHSRGAEQVTTPTVDTATTGRPVGSGMRLTVVTDVPAHVTAELSRDESFRQVQRIDGGNTNAYNGCFIDADALPRDQEFFWRARVTRQGRESVGPVRRFRTLPSPDQPTSPMKVVIGACATEFNQIFTDIANEKPDLFIWEGDLDYPDSVGALAQTVSGFSGMWKDFLWTPQLRPTLDRASFAPQRDDHDYGHNDVNAAKGIQKRGIEPWEHIMNPDIYYRFEAGSLAFWVLDSRRFTDPVSEPYTPDRSLIGLEQREWLLDGLATSDAPFKIICSPMPIFYSTNNDRGWAGGPYTPERDFILQHIRNHVSGQTVAITGDCHSGAAIKRGGILEVRAAPIDLPFAGFKARSKGAGVLYSGQGKFYSSLATGAHNGQPSLDVSLYRIGLGLGLDSPLQSIRKQVFHRQLVAT